MSKEAPETSKKLKLLGYRGLFFFFLAVKNLHHAKLLVGDGKYAHMPPGRQVFLNAFYVHLGIFAAGAVSQIGAELEHGEPVLHHLFSEIGIVLPVFLGFCGQIEKYHDPHNAIFVQSHVYDSNSGYSIFLPVPSKHFANEAVVRWAATCNGLCSPFNSTSTAGNISSCFFTDGVSTV